MFSQWNVIGLKDLGKMVTAMVKLGLLAEKAGID